MPIGAALVVDVVWLGDGAAEVDVLGLELGVGLDVAVEVGAGLGDAVAEGVEPVSGVEVPPEKVFTGDRLCHVLLYLYATKAVYVPAGKVRLPEVKVVCAGLSVGAVAPGKS
ncbi:hypothetical protein OG729_05725 [Streptomyces sp. NBC_00210]|uniref:hypothetical protein n=1 Tax=unclassified Streptomyces TaxID=2593676 RepID=UPI0032560142